MERGHWDTDASATVNASQWFRYSGIIPLYCSTSTLICSWTIFHRLPLFKQTPVWLATASKNMYVDEPESRNHFAIDSLNRLLLEQSAAIIASFFFFFGGGAGGRSRLMTISSSCSVQSVSSFRRHLHCTVGKSMDFPDLKTKTSD